MVIGRARGRCEATTGRYSRPTRECRVSTAPLQDRLLWRSPPRTIKGRPGTLDPRKELDAAVTILRPQSVCLAAGRWRSCRWLGRFARRLWRRSGGEGGHFRVVDDRLLRSCNPSCDSFGQLAQPYCRNSGPASVDATQPGTRRGWWRSEITPLCLGSSEASQALTQVYAVAGSREHPPPSTSLLGGGGPAGIVGKVEEGGWMSENLTRPVIQPV